MPTVLRRLSQQAASWARLPFTSETSVRRCASAAGTQRLLQLHRFPEVMLMEYGWLLLRPYDAISKSEVWESRTCDGHFQLDYCPTTGAVKLLDKASKLTLFAEPYSNTDLIELLEQPFEALRAVSTTNTTNEAAAVQSHTSRDHRWARGDLYPDMAPEDLGWHLSGEWHPQLCVEVWSRQVDGDTFVFDYCTSKGTGKLHCKTLTSTEFLLTGGYVVLLELLQSPQAFLVCERSALANALT